MSPSSPIAGTPSFSLVDCPKCQGTGIDPDLSTADCLILAPCKMCQESGHILANTSPRRVPTAVAQPQQPATMHEIL
jgi:hypothetical protein